MIAHRIQNVQAPVIPIVGQWTRDHGVAVLPGSAFGESAGCSIRISYGALDADTVIEGVQRLGRGLTQVL